MAEHQSDLDRWFLKQEVIDQLLAHGEDQDDAEHFGQRIATIAATEEAEHQSLHDRSSTSPPEATKTSCCSRLLSLFNSYESPLLAEPHTAETGKRFSIKNGYLITVSTSTSGKYFSANVMMNFS